ncbi:MAG: abortive infection family protein [Endomicrobium sp.]|nr:abortive infection family protein [Endomicrobium sp.]
MLEAIEKHPSDAIGKAKEVIESCCKTILSECGGKSGVDNLDKLDIHELIKNVREKLKLKSEHQAVKQIIGGLSGIAIGIAQLRNEKVRDTVKMLSNLRIQVLLKQGYLLIALLR